MDGPRTRPSRHLEPRLALPRVATTVALTIALTASTIAALLCLGTGVAHAWGAVFEDAVVDAAVRALPTPAFDAFAGDPGLWGAAGPWSDGWTGASVIDPATRVETAHEALRDALVARDEPRAARAFWQLARHTANLWQPLHAAGLDDAPGTRPGFHFRYETLLAARIDAASLTLAPPRAIRAPGPVAAAIAERRAGGLGLLADAESHALERSGGRFDERYLGQLWTELGDDLDRAASEAAQLLADLLYTAALEAGATTDADPVAAASGLVLRAVAPNPVRTTTGIELDLRESGRVVVDLYDATGRLTERLTDRQLAAGRHTVTIEPATVDRLAAGVYFLQVRSPVGIERRKLSVLR